MPMIWISIILTSWYDLSQFQIFYTALFKMFACLQTTCWNCKSNKGMPILITESNQRDRVHQNYLLSVTLVWIICNVMVASRAATSISLTMLRISYKKKIPQICTNIMITDDFFFNITFKFLLISRNAY